MFSFLQPATESLNEVKRHETSERKVRCASISFLIPSGVKAENLRMFDGLYDGIRATHGPCDDLDGFQPSARSAIARLPVPILGPGMLNKNKNFASGAENISNLFRILVEAERRLVTGSYENTADALVHAFSYILGHTLVGARDAIIRTAFDCEFFAPELVVMLEALRYE